MHLSGASTGGNGADAERLPGTGDPAAGRVLLRDRIGKHVDRSLGEAVGLLEGLTPQPPDPTAKDRILGRAREP
ncbi:hypothetical protein MN0502_03030 [Arthrobacter sp. MN05-02]|nr:hypothetical protein MN0502_03030 [Arthrobacter sp. MN05-02]